MLITKVFLLINLIFGKFTIINDITDKKQLQDNIQVITKKFFLLKSEKNPSYWIEIFPKLIIINPKKINTKKLLKLLLKFAQKNKETFITITDITVLTINIIAINLNLRTDNINKLEKKNKQISTYSKIVISSTLIFVFLNKENAQNSTTNELKEKDYDLLQSLNPKFLFLITSYIFILDFQNIKLHLTNGYFTEKHFTFNIFAIGFGTFWLSIKRTRLFGNCFSYPEEPGEKEIQCLQKNNFTKEDDVNLFSHKQLSLLYSSLKENYFSHYFNTFIYIPFYEEFIHRYFFIRTIKNKKLLFCILLMISLETKKNEKENRNNNNLLNNLDYLQIILETCFILKNLNKYNLFKGIQIHYFNNLFIEIINMFFVNKNIVQFYFWAKTLTDSIFKITIIYMIFKPL